MMNDNDSLVSFGLSDENDVNSMVRFATVHMTHKSMKVLHEVLKLGLSNFEKVNGEIVLPDGFIEKLQTGLVPKSSSSE